MAGVRVASALERLTFHGLQVLAIRPRQTPQRRFLCVKMTSP